MVLNGFFGAATEMPPGPKERPSILCTLSLTFCDRLLEEFSPFTNAFNRPYALFTPQRFTYTALWSSLVFATLTRLVFPTILGPRRVTHLLALMSLTSSS